MELSNLGFVGHVKNLFAVENRKKSWPGDLPENFVKNLPRRSAQVLRASSK